MNWQSWSDYCCGCTPPRILSALALKSCQERKIQTKNLIFRRNKSTNWVEINYSCWFKQLKFLKCLILQKWHYNRDHSLYSLIVTLMQSPETGCLWSNIASIPIENALQFTLQFLFQSFKCWNIHCSFAIMLQLTEGNRPFLISLRLPLHHSSSLCNLATVDVSAHKHTGFAEQSISQLSKSLVDTVHPCRLICGFSTVQ